MAEYVSAAGIEMSDAGHRNRMLEDFDAIQIVQHRDHDVGMVKLVKEANAWYLVQIQILPAFQRRGFATQLISSILNDAQRSSVCLRLSVL
ncbi:MAG: GNAT family N-acetyltransferase, partial [Verrucomicrobiota bacterium]